jgi:hypothetical protein
MAPGIVAVLLTTSVTASLTDPRIGSAIAVLSE